MLPFFARKKEAKNFHLFAEIKVASELEKPEVKCIKRIEKKGTFRNPNEIYRLGILLPGEINVALSQSLSPHGVHFGRTYYLKHITFL